MSTTDDTLTIHGPKLYQERARRALPLLVRQAQAGTSIQYANLAKELDMPNPRNLNYVLGSIGHELARLSDKWDEKIPNIQSLVLNKATGLPGDGFYQFVSTKETSLKGKRIIIERVLDQIKLYRRWLDVLDALKLEPLDDEFTELIDGARTFHGGGEGPLHKALKEYIAAHPEVLGLPKTMAPGTTEHPLPSGDSIDVFFESKTRWIAVEIKSRISSKDDQIRGLYQCVKYGAVLEAVAKTEDPTVSVETILVLESDPLFPLALEHALGIDVRSGITPPA